MLLFNTYEQSDDEEYNDFNTSNVTIQLVEFPNNHERISFQYI